MFAIAGLSDSGKTTLIERLIPILRQRGHRIATVKSSREDILPPTGTDTLRHLMAGSEMTILLGPSTTTINFPRRVAFETMIGISDVDIILIEGMKDSAFPKLWCLSREEDLSMALSHPAVRALVIDRDMTHLNIPKDIHVIFADELDKIAGLIESESMIIDN